MEAIINAGDCCEAVKEGGGNKGHSNSNYVGPTLKEKNKDRPMTGNKNGGVKWVHVIVSQDEVAEDLRSLDGLYTELSTQNPNWVMGSSSKKDTTLNGITDIVESKKVKLKYQ